MMRNTNFSNGIIKPVLAGLALLNLAIVLSATFALTKSRQQAETQAAIDTQNLSHVLEQSISGLVDKIDLLLLAAVDEIQNRMVSGGVDARKLNEFLRLQNRRVPDVFNLRISDEYGDLRYGSDFTVLPVANYADREAFLQQRDNPNAGLFIAKPVFGKTTQRWVLPFSRRINKPDGSFGGAVYAVISLDHFSKLFSVVEVGPKDTITLRDGELGIISSSGGIQLPGDLVGVKKVSKPFEEALKINPERGTYISGLTSIDKVSRTLSYLKFEKYPLYIITGVTEENYLAGWRKNVLEAAVLIVVFVLASAVFSVLLIRLLRRQHFYEKELYRQKEYLQAIFETEPECVKIVAPDGSLVDMNPAGLKMLEVDGLEEAQRLGMLAFVAPDYRQAFLDLNASVCDGNSGTLEFPIKGKHGAVRWLEIHATPLHDNHGKIVNLLGVARDITEHKLFRQELERQARIDYLTGVDTRRYFMEQAELELARAIRYGNNLSMFMLDIDFFKQINDRHGHKIGDQVLKKLAAVCREALREVDVIGRFGGEEFAILLPETGSTEAAEVAERLRSAVAGTQVPLENGQPIRFTVSIGVSTLASNDDDLDVLLNLADKALYEAKGSGRDKVCVAGR